MSEHEIQICVECKHPSRMKRMRGTEGGKLLLESVAREVGANGLESSFKIRPVACLGNCKRRSRITIVGRRRWTWSLGGLDPETDLSELMKFLRCWMEVETGLVPKAKRSKWLVKKALGRNPPQHET